MMPFRRFLSLVLLLTTVIAANSARAQTSQPTFTTIDLGHGFLIEVPTNWSRAPQAILPSAFNPRAGAAVSDVFHLTGSRPTDLPYATMEIIDYGGGFSNPTATQQQQLAQQVADYYATAFNPPSRADRPPLFKSAKVTPVTVDTANSRFTFSVIVKYDMIGEQHIDVSGAFGPSLMMLSSIWSDGTYYDANKPSVIAMRDSLRLGSVAKAPMKAGAIIKLTVQAAGVLVILALVIVQAYVLLKARRDRRAEEARFLS
jgi:hypothetical protein